MYRSEKHPCLPAEVPASGLGALLAQVLDDLSRQDEPCHGGDEGVAAWDVPAVGAVALGARRADAVGPAADGHILQGPDRLLLGVDYLQLLDSTLPELPAHDPGQGVHPGLVDVRYLEGGGVQLVPAPMELIMGVWVLAHCSTRASLAETVSTASTT